MRRDTLVDFFQDFVQISGTFLTFDDGYRRREYSYVDAGRAARGFAARLADAGLAKGDKVVFWGENRPEWVVCYWGCLLSGIVVVPIDYRSTLEFVERVNSQVRARVILVGDDVDGESPKSFPHVWKLADLDWTADGPMPAVPVVRDDVTQIIFTSGATAEPKGVVIRHRNVLANIVPVEREVMKYRKYARPFHPLRFLNLLPLSHMFGQSMASSIPPMVRGTVIFTRSFNPHDILGLIHRRRVSVLVCVPKILGVLREHVMRAFPEAADPPPPGISIPGRWWKYRRIHRAFGLKFWAFVVGAAPLPPDLEEFWRRLGFAVIQGYGLTETAPIVTLNHPFKTSKGSVGTPIEGVEVRIAEDGEILVRGENVTSGYYDSGSGARGPGSDLVPGSEPRIPDPGPRVPSVESRVLDADGWLHTGDIGERDAQGRLFIKGRKKEMIVRPDGLNVFPEDVERALEAQAGVRESAVVGAVEGAEERVHAVLVLEPDAHADAVIRQANAQLQEHQRIRTWSIWPTSELPRTEGTKKLKRRAIRDWVQSGSSSAPAATADTFEALLERFAHGRALGGSTTLEELGLSSLERVELMVALEDRFQTRIDEGRFSEDLEHWRSEATGRARLDHRTGRRARRFSDMEPPLARHVDSTALPGDMDSSPRPCVRTYASRRPGTSTRSRRPRGVRLKPSESHGRAGDSVRASGQMAGTGRAGDGQGVLQGALLPRWIHVARAFHQRAQLLPGGVLLQCVSAAAARGGRPANTAVHR